MVLTKFLAPRSSCVLAKEYLVSSLAAWDDKELVIVHTQAGQGKNTLAAAFAAYQANPAIWYTMDTEDGDPAVFLACFGDALRATDRPGVRQPGPPDPHRVR